MGGMIGEGKKDEEGKSMGEYGREGSPSN